MFTLEFEHISFQPKQEVSALKTRYLQSNPNLHPKPASLHTDIVLTDGGEVVGQGGLQVETVRVGRAAASVRLVLCFASIYVGTTSKRIRTTSKKVRATSRIGTTSARGAGTTYWAFHRAVGIRLATWSNCLVNQSINQLLVNQSINQSIRPATWSTNCSSQRKMELWKL